MTKDKAYVPNNDFVQEVIGVVLDTYDDRHQDENATPSMTHSEIVRSVMGMAWHAEMETGLFNEDLDPDDIKSVLLQVLSYLITS